MEFLPKLKHFIRQNRLWLGLVVVAVPLLINLALQYRALSVLQKTLPTARTVYMRRVLAEAVSKVNGIYKEKAEYVLSMPATAFLYRYPDPKEVHKRPSAFPRIMNPRQYLDYPQIEAHFRQHPFKGARLLFIGMVAGPSDPTFTFIDFYDPRSCSIRKDISSGELGAAHAAAANWTAMAMTNTKAPSLRLSVDERDPQNRLLVKPIADEKSRVVGVVGMFLDQQVFQNDFLLPALNEALPGAFPEEYREVVLTLNEKKNVFYASQPYEGMAYEVAYQLPFVFSDWNVGMRMKDMTEEQWSRRYFLTNLASSLLTALVLIGGIVLTLRTAARAMRLSQMKADFVSNVSHELRTPLASIRVFGEFLKMGRVRDGEKIREYGEYIETESRRLTQLINNILDFSKIESGQKTYHFEPADLEAVVAETLKTFTVRLEQSGFAITFDTPQTHFPLAVMDSDAIAQAFINLLDNAVKYSGESRTINVKLGQQDSFVTISVTDYGIGIAADERAKVFEKFYRVSTGLVHDVKGSGLGLSIVQHIVEAHQGKVTVESELGKGSTFTIHLPVDEHAQPREQANTGSLLGAATSISQSEI
ncbi:MAG: HAMP domain-containing histidine kinase [Acidobacteria bacterium]|nr:HAMP domain-containing histidine kinase [Acidobacteriota bacterium]MBI3427573.1 HAMP domain-containing histidine kinase [Acidobacteriota bacterium]